MKSRNLPIRVIRTFAWFISYIRKMERLGAYDFPLTQAIDACSLLSKEYGDHPILALFSARLDLPSIVRYVPLCLPCRCYKPRENHQRACRQRLKPPKLWI